MSILPSYTHIINPKLKHIYLTFDEEGSLIIKSPKVSQRDVEKVLLSKASWIRNAQKKFSLKKGRYPTFKENNELYFLGESHSFVYKQRTNAKIELLFDGDVFTYFYDTYDEKTLHRKIDAFYKKEAMEYIPDILEKWSKIMKTKATKLSFRKTKRQWGSCSSDNKISINTMIMKLPLDVIEYIVVHELSHIRHKHHQKDFWEHVSTYLPTYKKQVQILKNFTT